VECIAHEVLCAISEIRHAVIQNSAPGTVVLHH